MQNKIIQTSTSLIFFLILMTSQALLASDDITERAYQELLNYSQQIQKQAEVELGVVLNEAEAGALTDVPIFFIESLWTKCIEENIQHQGQAESSCTLESLIERTNNMAAASKLAIVHQLDFDNTWQKITKSNQLAENETFIDSVFKIAADIALLLQKENLG